MPDPQLDLFEREPSTGSRRRDGAPCRSRRGNAVTGLMTRLLVAHAGGRAEPGSDGDER